MTEVEIKEQLLWLDYQGHRIPTFCAHPDNNQPYPGLLLIHEIFGLNDHIQDLARRFARNSLCVFAPDLFELAANPPSDKSDLDQMRKVWQSLSDQLILDQLQAVYTFACHHPQVQSRPVGAIGYCMGGAIALMFACLQQNLSWIIDYYGRITYPELSSNKPKHPLDYVSDLNCPLLALFADKDDLISPVDRKLLQDQLENGNKEFEIQVFKNASHAFFNDTRPNFQAQAAQKAWEITISFINQQIAKRDQA